MTGFILSVLCLLLQTGDVTPRPPLTAATQQSDELQPSSRQQRDACVVFPTCITELRVCGCVKRDVFRSEV